MKPAVVADQAIPKSLREAISRRRKLALKLQAALWAGVTPEAFRLVDQLADLNRSIRQREWLPRVPGFDPIEMGC